MLAHAGIRIDLSFRSIEEPVREAILEAEAATA
jgi:hypothetical protein